ncbi:MAG: RluA family pseudouridine synthase [Alphaproteobacteria bacterium]|nr:RluA family pseudouridine synthase [Alphaproteobacteria bacterium]
MVIIEKISSFCDPETGLEGIFYKLQPIPSQDLMRLDRFLVEALPDLSRSRLQDLIQHNHIKCLKASKLTASTKVRSAYVYDLFIPNPESAIPLPQDIELSIVYEDADLIVLDKPAGLVMHPAPGNQDQTLVNALLHHCGDSLSGIGGVKRPGIVHRLDKDTSGLIVVAKNDLTHQDLTRQFSERSIDRAYKALVWGVPSPKEGDIEGDIGRHPTNRKKMAIVQKNGRYALTHYKVDQTFAMIASLVDCKLATGRTHQIRVHLASKGHSIIGDPVYGGLKIPSVLKNDEIKQEIQKCNRQMLHAYRLGFIHPVSKKHLFFESNITDDYKFIINLFDKL